MNPPAQPVISVSGLWRFYGRSKKVEAVRDVSFDVRRGEIFGLIGPDGAGKTSIIQILAGVLNAHRGSATVGGINVLANPEAVKERIGYMPQGLGVNLYESLTVAENIDFFRELRKLPENIYRENRANFLKMTRLDRFVDRRAANLSGGMRQKLALICTLIHLPDVILLDEPTTGVDPISRQEFWQIIHRLVEQRHVTVLLSTSYMDEAERCHRVALVHSGVVIDQGTPDSIRRKATGHYARIVAEPQTTALRILQQRDDVSATEVFGREIRVRSTAPLGGIESDLRAEGLDVQSLTVEEPKLEDVFLQLLAPSKQRTPTLRVAAARHIVAESPIECHGVTRRFGEFVAVDQVHLHVERGEIFGLLGPNGAGKTTLIKMLCGLLEPSAGSIRVAGFDIAKEKRRVWTQIGYMSQQFSLYRDLTVQQNLRLYADLYGVQNAASTDMTASLGLEPFQSRLAGDLPTGLRQRLSLLCAVLHGPPVLFLDEPTSGVDPPARRVFWDLIYSLSRESGVTVLVSTHYMDEADHCDRLGLMNQGLLIAADSPGTLKQISENRSGKLLSVRTHDFSAAFDVITTRFADAVLYGDSIRLRSFDPATDEQKLLSLLSNAGIAGTQISSPPLSMDETFLDFIRYSERVHA
ncbi:MAG: ABC transporter ATP-binding protein [Acidobacteria bacterium]|nr:ABC transporter ATP-binding protein [Acidobacteriota bacterium]